MSGRKETRTVNKCFLMFRENLPCFSFCMLLPLVLPWHTTLKRPALFPLHLSFRYLFPLSFPLSLLFARLSSSSSLSHSFQGRCSCLLIILVAFGWLSPVCRCLPCTEEPRRGHTKQQVLTYFMLARPWRSKTSYTTNYSLEIFSSLFLEFIEVAFVKLLSNLAYFILIHFFAE